MHVEALKLKEKVLPLKTAWFVVVGGVSVVVQIGFVVCVDVTVTAELAPL